MRHEDRGRLTASMPREIESTSATGRGREEREGGKTGKEGRQERREDRKEGKTWNNMVNILLSCTNQLEKSCFGNHLKLP